MYELANSYRFLLFKMADSNALLKHNEIQKLQASYITNED